MIGEDTDLLILLLYHAPKSGHKLYLRSDKNLKSGNYSYDIKKCKSILGEQICKLLLFLHAFTGFDSCSRIYGVGKSTAFTKLLDNPTLRKVASVFSEDNKSHQEIEEAGKQALIILFGDDLKQSLNRLRYLTLVDKVTNAKSFVTPERLSKTESAAKFHSYRVYYQVRFWRGNQVLKPTDWGWIERDGHYEAIMMDQPPAPENLLQIIHCNCKTGCSSIKCGCRKNDLPCSTACGTCQTDGCDNISNIISEEVK